MKNRDTVSHNVCYSTLVTLRGYQIKGWSVRVGDVVFDKDLNKYGVVEDCFSETLDSNIPALLYVRFCSPKGDFTARYLPCDAEAALTFCKDCLVCSNGVVRSADSVVLTGYLGSPVGCVARIHHGCAFVKLREFGVWCSPTEFVKLEKE